MWNIFQTLRNNFCIFFSCEIFHKLNFQMYTVQLILFFLQSTIFAIMSAPLHSLLLRPKVQGAMRLLLIDFKIARLCGVEIDLLACIFLCSALHMMFGQPSDKPLLCANMMMYYCIHAYFKLRCKYERVRDELLKSESADE